MSRKNVPTDVFRFINTHGNDPEVCWEWTGSKGGRDERGYITLDGTKKQSHRVVYEIMYGPIPEGVVIRHKCDHPWCNNPFHLEPGTRSDNEKDKSKRDRSGIPRDIVMEIRRHRGKMTQEVMAKFIFNKYQYKLSRSAVQKIWSGERRKED